MSDIPLPSRPSRIGVLAMYLVFSAVIARTLAIEEIRPFLGEYLVLELVYAILFTVFVLRPGLLGRLVHLYFVFQSLLVLRMLSLRPDFDFVVLLFALLCYQASLIFSGRMRWIWVGGLTLLTGGSLMFYLGLFHGLALALTTMASEIVIPAYLVVNRETEIARAESQVMLGEIDATHRQLQQYAGQVEELASMQERHRLARELHDTVSQLIFSIALTARSAQLLLKRDPARLPEQLNRLQAMTTDALSQLRSFITQLRPTQKS